MNNLSIIEFGIIRDVLVNCWGYPMSKDNSVLLGFDSELCLQLKNIIKKNFSNYILSEEEKHIILKSFEVFLSEMSTDEESIPLTDHTKLEVQELYEKLKEMYKD